MFTSAADAVAGDMAGEQPNSNRLIRRELVPSLGDSGGSHDTRLWQATHISDSLRRLASNRISERSRKKTGTCETALESNLSKLSGGAMRICKGWIVPVLVLTAAVALLATTWGPVEVECPVCHTKNTFNSWMSYGSYVYGWPSKFQNIYWPATDSNSLHTCKHCYLTLFMGDY